MGIERLLDVFSNKNHGEYCLAYLFTKRVFENGVLGLAWVGGRDVGICAKPLKNGKNYNTGIISIARSGSGDNIHIAPLKISALTLAHEIGHSFGSRHNTDCSPEDIDNGYFLMHPYSTNGNEVNNYKFSSCSISSMEALLKRVKNSCFVESNEPICGNQIIEVGEECDCGYGVQCNENCCYPADYQDKTKRCTMKRTGNDTPFQCSPSQGSCCNEQCSFMSSEAICAPETDCSEVSYCSGNSGKCGKRTEKNGQCDAMSKICQGGICSGSVCKLYDDMEPCQCENIVSDPTRGCQVCCKKLAEPDTCIPTKQLLLFNRTIYKEPGSACNQFQGYCDIFSNCRSVNSDGPLALIMLRFSSEKMFVQLIGEWLKVSTIMEFTPVFG